MALCVCRVAQWLGKSLFCIAVSLSSSVVRESTGRALWKVVGLVKGVLNSMSLSKHSPSLAGRNDLKTHKVCFGACFR